MSGGDAVELEPRVLQRVIFPTDSNLDIVPLYVETDLERGADRAAPAEPSSEVTNAVLGATQSSVRFGSHDQPATAQRFVATIRGGRRVSFATYFNAFPASYWRRWTVVESVTLRVRLEGSATIVVYRSTANGHSHPVRTVEVDSGDVEVIDVHLPLTQFVDGGWYWFDVAAGPDGATLLQADWLALVPPRPTGTLSIGITTYNRPGFLVDLLRSIGGAPDVLERLDAVYVVDQGTDQVTDHVDFADAAKGLGDRLEVIVQGNLGGSGGFSRAMHETLQAAVSDYVVLLDDDVVLEPEGLLRAVTFADLARRPTIVGGHMFSLHDRSVLHAFGETVSPYKWWWGAAPHTETGHDFGRQGLRHTPWLHRRADADYNGWWMCLIPTRIIAELGLALPVFIKWDDAEYGLRAQAAGYQTVSMPGVAVWHVPWYDKNDAVDWQAYYHVRNRLVVALLHSPYDRGGRVVAESMETQIQHLLSMQYSTATLRVKALEDLLSGPEHLHRDLATTLGDLATLRRGFHDAQSAPDIEAFPPVRRRKPPSRGREITSPSNKLALALQAGLGGLRQVAPVSKAALQRPAAALPHQDASWWLLSAIDSALVSAADGASTAWYQREPQTFRRLLLRSARLHARLLREWPRLAAEYRDAAADIAARDSWQATFEASRPEPRIT